MSQLTHSQPSLVFVLYNPSPAELEHLVMIASRFKGAIADNSAEPSFCTSMVGRMRYVSMNGNKGIAAAQNAALKMVLEDSEVQHVVFFDQDSVFAYTYPEQMVGEFELVRKTYPNLGALGATIVDKENGKVYRSVIHKERRGEGSFVFNNEVIASGTCISREAIEAVGMFDEQLFIDFVDCEWCFRALSKGFVCGTTTALQLQHKVGQRMLNIFGHIVIISAPKRYFYQYRNLLLLISRAYVPLSFKVNKGVKFFLRLIYFPFIKGGIARWLYMWRGMFAAITTKGKR